MRVEGLDQVLRNLDALTQKLERASATAAAEIAVVLEAYAKKNHPWQRDSGFTDTSTLGEPEQTRPDLIRVILSAGMDYDVFLELAREGRWAWLMPAILANKDRALAIWERHLRGVL